MVNINVPYLSQLDNEYNPCGSCNVTSAAMILNWAGIPTDPDNLYDEMLVRGLSRHSPYDLAVMIEDKGAVDTFVPNASINDIIKHLDRGNPVIVHGYFTGFGHIIVIKGYENKDFICHDPYGEWFASGYRTNEGRYYGKDIRYSFRMIDDLCNDGGIWTHMCQSKGTKPPARPPVAPVYNGLTLQDVFQDNLNIPLAQITNIEVQINFQIQVTLGDRYKGKRDAILGPVTKEALCKFCEEVSLPPDPISKPLAKMLIEGKAKLR